MYLNCVDKRIEKNPEFDIMTISYKIGRRDHLLKQNSAAEENMDRTRACWENQDKIMDVDEVIARVEQICKANGVEKLCLFGSFAKGTAAFTSDIDFVVYGCKDLDKLEQDLEQIDTLRKIDIFEFETINDRLLLEDIRRYEKQIY